MREEHRHGGRSEIGMDIPRECAILRREQFREEGLGGQECRAAVMACGDSNMPFP